MTEPTGGKESIDDEFEMTDRRRRRPKVVPRAAADFVRQLIMKGDSSVKATYYFV